MSLAGAEVTGQLLGLHGWDTSRTVRAPRGTAYGTWALVPELTGTVGEDPDGTLFAALASLSGDPGPAPLTGLATAEVSGRTLTVRWPDGARTVVDFGDGAADTVPTVREETA